MKWNRIDIICAYYAFLGSYKPKSSRFQEMKNRYDEYAGTAFGNCQVFVGPHHSRIEGANSGNINCIVNKLIHEHLFETAIEHPDFHHCRVRSVWLNPSEWDEDTDYRVSVYHHTPKDGFIQTALLPGVKMAIRILDRCGKASPLGAYEGDFETARWVERGNSSMREK